MRGPPRTTRTTQDGTTHDYPEGIESFSPRLARRTYLGWVSKMISTLKGLAAVAAERMQPFQGWG